MVVEFRPMVSSVGLIKSNSPFVDDGLAICKSKIPFTVRLLCIETPPNPLSVRLLTSPVKVDVGSAIALSLAKIKVAPTLLVLMFPFVRVILLPDNVNVLAPIVSVPLAKLKESFTFMF